MTIRQTILHCRANWYFKISCVQQWNEGPTSNNILSSRIHGHNTLQMIAIALLRKVILFI